MNAKKRALIAASVAGLMAAAAVGTAHGAEGAAAPAGKKVPCYGINKCKGTGDCGGKGHGCAGKNACEGKGYINLSKDDCLRIKGGSLTEAAG